MCKYPKSVFLLVDDEDSILKVLSKQLNFWGYSSEKADSGLAALEKISEKNYDLIFLDMNLEDMSGLEVLEEIHKINDLTQVIMVTSLNHVEYFRSAIREGAFDYIVKPWSRSDLRDTIIRALDYRRFLVMKQESYTSLNKEIKNKTKEQSMAVEQIHITYDKAILALGSALETRASGNKEHGFRVAHYSQVLAKKMGFSDHSFLINLQRGAYLHDIGKIGVPDQIFKKEGSLTYAEWEIIKKHPGIGKSIVEGIPFLHETIPVIYYHHEKYDGSGYPQALKGKEIPIEALIFSVADAFDALTSDRCYRSKVSFKKAIEIISANSGDQFYPEVVKSLNSLTEIELSQWEVTNAR